MFCRSIEVVRLLISVFVILNILAFWGSEALTQNIDPSQLSASDTAVGRQQEAPTNRLTVSKKFWWDEEWYENGIIAQPNNFEIVERHVAYINKSDDTEIPAILYRPKQSGKFPGVLFQHGRRGLDDLVQRLAKRIAARGFIVLAPDVYTARFIDPFPVEHLTETENDVDAGIDYLLNLPDVSTRKICFYSHTRGGYYTLIVATKLKRQNKTVACYVSSYPHWQNPNSAEPMQIYRYASEIEQLEIPSLIFIGEYEQYHRRSTIEMAVTTLKKSGRDIRLIIYPGVGRGFDFRPESVRTFADDLATKDAIKRAANFINLHLKPRNTN